MSFCYLYCWVLNSLVLAPNPLLFLTNGSLLFNFEQNKQYLSLNVMKQFFVNPASSALMKSRILQISDETSVEILSLLIKLLTTIR